jgi:hypothetical protein
MPDRETASLHMRQPKKSAYKLKFGLCSKKLASKKFQNYSMAVFDIHLSAQLVALNIVHDLFELNSKYPILKARLDVQTREDLLTCIPYLKE